MRGTRHRAECKNVGSPAAGTRIENRAQRHGIHEIAFLLAMGLPESAIRVLVTGSEGFVGAAVVRALIERHPEYLVLGLDIAGKLGGQDSDDGDITGSDHKGIPCLKADVRDQHALQSAFAKARPNVIVHTAGLVPQGAARYSKNDWVIVRQANVQGTANVLDASRLAGVKALVYTSTCCVVTDDLKHDYPNFDETTPIPASLLTYGKTKAEAERLVLQANSGSFSTCALRPSVIFGEMDYQLIPSLHACIAKGETPFLIGDGDNLYDFTYVGNVADAHVLAVENLLSAKTAAGQAINVSNGQPVTFRDFCLAVWGAFGHSPPYTLRIPRSVASAAGCLAGCYTWISRTPATLSRGSVSDASGTRYADISKAREMLGFEPLIDLADAVRISAQVGDCLEWASLFCNDFLLGTSEAIRTRGTRETLRI